MFKQLQHFATIWSNKGKLMKFIEKNLEPKNRIIVLLFYGFSSLGWTELKIKIRTKIFHPVNKFAEILLSSHWVLQPEQAFSYSYEKSSSLVEETFIFKKHKHINICIHRFEAYMQGYHTVLISKIRPHFVVLRLRKY